MDLMPSNLEAERGLLGIIMVRNDTLFAVSGIVTPDDFWDRWNGELFRLLLDQIGASRAVSAITLMSDAEDADVGGISARDLLRKLEDEAPPAEVAEDLARAIRDAAIKRRVIAACDEIRSFTIGAPVSVSAAEIRIKADDAMARLFSSAEDLGLRPAASVGDGLISRARIHDQGRGLGIGLAGLQNLLGPLQGGRVYYLGGAPGSGKSALILQIAADVSGQGVPVACFSPEMPSEELVERELGSMADVSPELIERLALDRTQLQNVFDANERLRGKPLFIDDAALPTMATIRGKALRKKKMGGLGLISIDHVHYLAKPDRRMSETEALDDNCRAIKRLAKDLDVPIIVACMFGTEALKDMAKWPHRRPTQGDLLYSGVIDRNADAIVLVHRDEYFLSRNEPERNAAHYGDWSARKLDAEGRALFILTKRRGGKGWGTASCGFIADRGRFTETAARTVPADDIETLFPLTF